MAPLLRYRDPITGLFEPLNAPPTDLDSLTDVDISTVPPADGDTLVWDANAGQWVPGAATAVGAALLTFDVPAAGGTFPLVHNLGQRFVTVQVFDPDGELVTGVVELVDADTAQWTGAGRTPGNHTAVIVGAAGPTSPASVIPGTPSAAWATTGSVTFAVSPGGVTAALDGLTYTGATPLPADGWAPVVALPAGVPAPPLAVEWTATYGTAATGSADWPVRLRVDPTFAEIQARSYASRTMSPNKGLTTSTTWVV